MDDAVCLGAVKGVDGGDEDFHTNTGCKGVNFFRGVALVEGFTEGYAVLRVHTFKVCAHGVDAGLDALTDCYRGHDNDELGEPVVLGKFEDGAQVDVGFAGTGFHFDVVVGHAVFYLKLRAVLEVVAFLHLNKVVEEGFSIKVETVVYNAGGARCEEGVLFGGGSIGSDAVAGAGYLGLPFEERHGGVDGTHLVLL